MQVRSYWVGFVNPLLFLFIEIKQLKSTRIRCRSDPASLNLFVITGYTFLSGKGHTPFRRNQTLQSGDSIDFGHP